MKRGSIVLVSGQWLKYGLQLASLVVLARLMDPADFGTLALVTSLTGIASVVGDFGLSLSALRAKVLSRPLQSMLLWANVLIGLILAASFIALSPLIGVVYGRPDIVPLILLLSSTFVLNGAAVQFKVVLNRSAKYIRLSMTDVLGQLAGFVLAVILAAEGFGVWALAWQLVAAAFSGLVLAALFSRWRPSRPSLRSGLRAHARFGLATFGTQVANYVSTNADTVLLGVWQKAAEVGLYNRAFQLSVLPVQQLAAPLTRAVLPSLAGIDSVSAFHRKFRRLQVVFAYVALPVLLMLLVNSGDLVAVVLGQQWRPAAPILQLLAVASAFQVLAYPLYWASLVKAKVGVLFWTELPGRLLIIAGSYWMAKLGAVEVASAVVVGQFVMWVVGVSIAPPAMKLRRSHFLAPLVRPLVAVCVLAICELSAGVLARFFGLDSSGRLAASLGGVVVSVGILLAFRGFRAEFKELLAFRKS
ncbi:lipopolysaccharide biosynthesis protein [Curtobacterium sp. MCBD17_023]|uniref:lipopolysaccharide biosynthesis protein n=1 Tax=Curtobacterium sp. MCBD17_023 TaxID=2175657 RepID=UPI000D80F5F4|nr:lipopolysaccharide biosynthesis protein [Curtobacterium sp. MCBD17_023]PYY48077.1 hypothetical protein DEI84_10335 [Curtobacterium sp. MCBD17_023]